KASAGQSLVAPSQLSARSHTPAEARHEAVLFASAGQSLVAPSQLSARSHTPAEARHWAVLFESVGHVALLPVQFWAGSHTPAEARQTTDDALKFGWHVVAPSHVSGLSQTVLDESPQAVPAVRPLQVLLKHAVTSLRVGVTLVLVVLKKALYL